MAGRPRKFQCKLPWDVVAELDQLLRDHPELPYKSLADAMKHAAFFFTNELRRQLAEGVEPKRTPSDDEIMGFIQRFYAAKQRETPKTREKKGHA